MDALKAGIGMVHQEFSLIPGFSVAENIVLNRETLVYNPLVEAFGDPADHAGSRGHDPPRRRGHLKAEYRA